MKIKLENWNVKNTELIDSFSSTFSDLKETLDDIEKDSHLELGFITQNCPNNIKINFTLFHFCGFSKFKLFRLGLMQCSQYYLFHLKHLK